MHGEVIAAGAGSLGPAGVDEGGAVEAEEVELVEDEDAEVEALGFEECVHMGNEDLELLEPVPEGHEDAEAVRGGVREWGSCRRGGVQGRGRAVAGRRRGAVVGRCGRRGVEGRGCEVGEEEEGDDEGGDEGLEAAADAVAAQPQPPPAHPQPSPFFHPYRGACRHPHRSHFRAAPRAKMRM